MANCGRCRLAVWALLCFGGCLRHARLDDRPTVAWVGSMPIYVDDFKRQLGRLRLEPDDAGPPPPQSEQTEKRALLDAMIDARLLLTEAEKHNVTVPQDAVDAAYQKLHGGWRDDDFATLLKEKDLTATEIKSDLRETLLVRKYLRDFVFARVAVTDAEIDTYIKEHPDSLSVAEQVHARQLVVKTQEQASSILADLHGRGLTFEDAASKYSLTPDGKSGGDLGWFARGIMPKIFDDTCFALRPGELSDVVASPYGYHLFKVLERHPQAQHAQSQVRDAIELQLRQTKERAAHQEKMRELRGGAAVQIKEDALAAIL